MNTDKLHQAESIARLIMFADELGHEMADDLNIAFSVVDDILQLAIKDNPNINILKDASVIASAIVAAEYGDSERDEIAQAGGVVARMIGDVLCGRASGSIASVPGPTII